MKFDRALILLSLSMVILGGCSRKSPQVFMPAKKVEAQKNIVLTPGEPSQKSQAYHEYKNDPDGVNDELFRLTGALANYFGDVIEVDVAGETGNDLTNIKIYEKSATALASISSAVTMAISDQRVVIVSGKLGSCRFGSQDADIISRRGDNVSSVNWILTKDAASYQWSCTGPMPKTTSNELEVFLSINHGSFDTLFRPMQVSSN